MKRQAARLTLDDVGQLVSLEVAAQRLSISIKTLRREIDCGRIRAVKIGRGRGVWRVSLGELARVIDEGTCRV